MNSDKKSIKKLLVSGEVIDNDLDIAQALNSFYVSVGPNISNSIPNKNYSSNSLVMIQNSILLS